MAKNYTFAEAVAIINEGKDLEAITDIGRRYPILMHKVTRVSTLAGQDFVDLMGFMPDYLTANKVNSAMKAGVGEAEATEDAGDDEIKKPKKMAEATEEDEATEGTDYTKMASGDLYKLIRERGLMPKDRKVTKKAEMIEILEAADANGGNTEAEEEATEDAGAYDGKSAMELFKECKKRGIKAEPKKPAKFYIDLLTKDDAKKSEAEESESDDWGDEEEATEEPKAKKAAAKKAEKPKAKKAEPKEESEDDDWDI